MDREEVARLVEDVVANHPWTMGYFLEALQEAAYKEAEFARGGRETESWGMVGDAIGKSLDVYNKRRPLPYEESGR